MEYFDFANVFSKESAKIVLERTSINKHAIKSVNSKHLSYRPIYSLGSVKFKTLNTYIKINLTNNFIKSSKFLVGALIFLI